jgi:hypothetical protein
MLVQDFVPGLRAGISIININTVLTIEVAKRGTRIDNSLIS